MKDNKENNLKEAILKLAEIIDYNERIPEEVKNHPKFRSRQQLIMEILNNHKEDGINK